MVRISYGCGHDGTSSSSFWVWSGFVVGGEWLPFSMYRRKIKENYYIYIYFNSMVFYCVKMNLHSSNYEKFGLDFVWAHKYMAAFLKRHVTQWFQFVNGKWKVRRVLPATCPWTILSWSENLFCRMVFLPYNLMLLLFSCVIPWIPHISLKSLLRRVLLLSYFAGSS